MVCTGTLINTAAIVAGGLAGLFGGSWLKERHRATLMTACGTCVMFIGIAGALEGMLSVSDGKIVSGQSMMITICFALGAIIGESINLEDRFEQFGEWLKAKSGNSGDAGFVDAFVTASLTVSIGAMAVMGSIADGVNGDYSILAVKAMLDLIIIMVMTGSMGKGCIFSAIPVFVFEGAMTLLAGSLKTFMNELALSYLSMTGSILIFCIGMNLVFGKKVRAANLLPALLVAVVAAMIQSRM